MEYAENLNFTKEELEYFEKMIEESREMQRQNGNKTYTIEEVMNSLEPTEEEIKKIQELRKKSQNHRKMYTKEKIEEMFNIEDSAPEELMVMLQEEESDYHKN